MTEETKFKNKIKKFLNSLNIYNIPYFPTIYTPNGVPDILACVSGFWVAIEVKSATGCPSKLQLHHQKKIQESGGRCYILYPKDFEDFKIDILKLYEA